MKNLAIEVKDLRFAYQEDDVLHGVSFGLEKGKYLAILGPNGSGKSTLAKLLIGLLEKKSGSITILGQELNLENLSSIRNKVGIVFQNPDSQFIGSTVRDDIAFGLENHCVEREKMDSIIEEFAEKVDMTPFLDSEPTKLSGGQKQRVSIAGVLAMDPEILIFDEATSMLDPEGKREINDLIHQIHLEKNRTMIMITHDIEEAAQCDEVLVMDQGRVVMQGTPKEVLTQEKELEKHQLHSPFLYQLIDECNRQGIKLNHPDTLEDAAEELWQYVSTK